MPPEDIGSPHLNPTAVVPPSTVATNTQGTATSWMVQPTTFLVTHSQKKYEPLRTISWGMFLKNVSRNSRKSVVLSVVFPRHHGGVTIHSGSSVSFPLQYHIKGRLISQHFRHFSPRTLGHQKYFYWWIVDTSEMIIL